MTSAALAGEASTKLTANAITTTTATAEHIAADVWTIVEAL